MGVAVLKSWDFADWRDRYGHGTELPYRMDLLERHGIRLLWSDSVHRSDFRESKTGRSLQRIEAATVPFSQTILMRRAIRSSPATLALFESEANFLAIARWARITSRRPALVVLSCWLAHILKTCSARRLAGYRKVYRSVDRLYYLSANQGPVLEELLELPADRLRYLPFGIDTDAFVPSGRPDGDYLLAVGRDRGRDWPTFFRAVDGIGIQVKVCCRRADLTGLSIPENVEVLGYVDRNQYRSLLSRAKVVVITAKPVVYPSGQSVMLEAMAMGRTVVVTSTPAMEGYIQAGIDCLAAPQEDAGAVRSQIIAAVEDDDRRAKIGAAARKSVVNSYGAARMWSTVAKDISTLTNGNFEVARD